MKYKDTLITAKELRQSSTPSEKILWNALRNRQFNNLKFRRQHVIAGFVLDFYCSSIKLGIEVDGEVHRREENRNYDKERDLVIKEHGVTIMRIESRAIELALPAVLRAIAFALNIKPSPTKLERVPRHLSGRVRSK